MTEAELIIKLLEGDSTYAGTIDDFEVIIDVKSLEMFIWRLLPNDEKIEIAGGDYPSLKVLSADLRDNLSLSLAIKFLKKNRVPKDSDLWDLNHSNPWK